MLTITETTKRQGRVGILPNISDAKAAAQSLQRLADHWQERGRKVIMTSAGMIVEAYHGSDEIEYRTELAHAA